MVELDNGARLMAEAGQFEQVFEISNIDGEGPSSQRFVTEGQIVNQALKPSAT